MGGGVRCRTSTLGRRRFDELKWLRVSRNLARNTRDLEYRSNIRPHSSVLLCQGASEFGSAETPSRENWVYSRRVHIHPGADVLDLAWTEDDRWLASGGHDSVVVVLDGVTLNIIHRLPCDGPAKGVAWSPAQWSKDGTGLPLLAAQVDVAFREEDFLQPFMVWDPSSAWAAMKRSNYGQLLHGTSQNIQFTRISWGPLYLAKPKVIFVNCKLENLPNEGARPKRIGAAIHLANPQQKIFEHIDNICGE